MPLGILVESRHEALHPKNVLWELWTSRLATGIDLPLKPDRDGNAAGCPVRHLVQAQSIGKVLQQNHRGRLSWLTAPDPHRKRAKLQALGVYVGTCAVGCLDVNLPWLPIVPGGPPAVQLHPRGEDYALRLSIAGEVPLRGLPVVPSGFSGDSRWNGRVDQLDGRWCQ